jgi:hypothetical protein
LTKKLNLSDFLAQTEPETIVRQSSSTPLTYSLQDFKSAIEFHSGDFLIDNKVYPAAISSDYSVYFYEGERSPFLIVYESILDIKRRENTLSVFSDDQSVISITLL